MSSLEKSTKTGTLQHSNCNDGATSTPVSNIRLGKSKSVRSKKYNDEKNKLLISSENQTTDAFNTTLEPGMMELFCDPTSTKKSCKKKSNVLNENLPEDKSSPCLADLLDISAKKAKTPRPNTVDEVFEHYMEQDPYASIWKFIPRDESPSPDRPLTFFSPVKDRPVTYSALPNRHTRNSSPSKESCGTANDTPAGVSEKAGESSSRSDLRWGLVTPLFGKRLGVAAYSPCGSADRNFPRINCSSWSGLNDSGSTYSPAPSCSTPNSNPFKTPTPHYGPSNFSSGAPLSGVRSLFQNRSHLIDSPSGALSQVNSLTSLKILSPAYRDVPDSVKGSILLGVICFVDCKYNKEDRAKYVQKECLALGAKVEKNFTKKVTHVIFKGGKMSTYMKAKENNIPMVSLLWLEACKTVGNMVDPALYPPTDDEWYQKEMPFEEARKRERFYKRGRAFLDRINGLLPAKPIRTRSGRKGHLASVTEAKRKTKVARMAVAQQDKSVANKVPKKLIFTGEGSSHQKKPENGDSDYVSESDSEERQSKRRKSAPADIGGNDGSKRNLTELPNDVPPAQRGQTPDADGNELLKALTGGFTTTDKKRRKLFDPNQSLMSQPLPATPLELSPYIKASPTSKRSTSRGRTTSSNKRPSRSKTSSSKATRRVREAKRPVTARKSLVPLLEQQEEGADESVSASTSRNSLGCFDLVKKYKTASKCQPRIAFTGLPKDAVLKYKNIISQLGSFGIDSSVTKKTTHLLTSIPVRRTVNLLKALARGCWILDVEWVTHCQQNGKWMSEEPFEQKTFSDAVTASRLEKQAFGKDYSMDLFSSFGPIFVTSDVQPPRADLIALVKICCGKVVSCSSKADVIISTQPLTEANPSVVVVSPLWVLESITHYKRMEFDKYKLTAIDDMGT